MIRQDLINIQLIEDMIIDKKAWRSKIKIER